MRNESDVWYGFGKPDKKFTGIKYLICLTLCVAGLGLTVRGGAADLDHTFGNVGKVVSSPDGTPNFTTAGMAQQADGKIVIVGNRGQYPNSRMFVARYNPDGSLDTTFGDNGLRSLAFGAGNETAASAAIQEDGKIVVGGSLIFSHNPGVSYEFAFARLNANGSLDTSFGGDGMSTVDVISGMAYSEFLSVIKIASNGKIVAAGQASFSFDHIKFVLTRINADGSRDSTFGTDGVFVDEAHVQTNVDRLLDLVVLPDGKIVAVGLLWKSFHGAMIAIKYNEGAGREWTYAFSSGSEPFPVDVLNGIASLPDGKFIVVGKRAGSAIAIRLNADGTKDNTFIHPAIPFSEILSLAIQSDGKIVGLMEGSGFSLVRLNSDGSLDTGFGSGGFVTSTRVSDGVDSGTELLIQSDAKILVAGTSQFGSPTGSHIAMARYKGESAFPETCLFDYDGDGRSDVSVFRPSSGYWYLNQSTDGISSVPFGISTDRIAPADFDGDAKADIAIYRDGTWWILQSSNSVAKAVQFGLGSDTPQSGDFDNDGRDDLVVFRPSISRWYVLKSTDGGIFTMPFGAAGDIPLSGDYDGDGVSDPAIFRPSTGAWWYAASSAAGQHRTTSWGLSTDRPAPADYDGDGKTDLAVYRPAEGLWFILNSGGTPHTITNFGLAEDRPVPADYDGDGKADIALFRPSTGIWYMLQSTAGFGAINWGVSTDVPTQSAFIP